MKEHLTHDAAVNTVKKDGRVKSRQNLISDLYLTAVAFAEALCQ